MTYLFPGIRPPTTLASGIPDGTTRRALASVEAWAAEVSARLARVTAAQVSGLVVPIAESDVTGLAADLAARPTGSGAAGRSARWTSTAALGNGAFSDDGTNVSLAGDLTLATMTAGSVLFAGSGGLVSQDNANLFYDDATNRLGIGTSAPATTAHVVGDASVMSGSLFVGTTSNPWTALQTNATFTKQGTFNTVTSVVFSNTAGDTSGFTAFKARGTIGAPLAIQSGDAIGAYSWTGATDNANNHFSGAYLLATATENWATGTNSGTKVELFTTKNATSFAAGGRKARIVVDQDGTVAIPGAANTGTTALIVGATAFTKTGTAGSAEFTKDAANVVTISAFGTGNPSLQFLHGRGTAAATTATQSGDTLGSISFAGATGSLAANTFGSVFINGTATENWGAGATGSKIDFTTCLTGSTTRTVKLAVENDGGITLTNSASAAVSGSSELRLRYSTTTTHRLQYSANAGAYVDVATQAAAGGVANTMPKWSNTTGLLANSLLTDNATTLSYNAGKFTVTAASGNTSVAGTLGVTGLATLTGGFTLGADSSANSHKITSLTNGSSAQDAAAFGQIASGINAAVSGTTNTLAKFTSANVVGNSSITDDGTVVRVGTYPFFEAATGNLNGDYATNGTSGLSVNYSGYLNGTTQFRDFAVYDGKHNLVMSLTGSSKAASFAGAVSVAGGATLTYATVNSTVGGDALYLHDTAGDARVRIDSGGTNQGYLRFVDGGQYMSLSVGAATNDHLSILSTGEVQVGAFTSKGTTTLCDGTGDTLKFYGGTGATQQTITGSRGGNAALADLLTKLATLGLIVDSTSA